MATTKKTAARSGNPAKKASVSTAKGWKGKDKSLLGQELELPSENVCKAKRISPLDLVASGKMPDSLSQIVTQAINENKGLPPSKLAEMTQDMEQLRGMVSFIDQVVLDCVIEPQVLPDPEEGEDIDPEALYVHQVDMTDKIFIMQWAIGGSPDLIQFRAGLSGGMAAIQAVGDVEEASE